MGRNLGAAALGAVMAGMAASPLAAQQNESAAWFAAAVSGDTATLQRMLDQGQSIDTRDGEANGAIHLAADKCHAATIRLLLSRGADRIRPNKWNDTPLRIATVRCGGGSDVVVALTGSAAQAAAPASIALAAGETSEPNSLPCPAAGNDQRALFDQLAPDSIKKDPSTGWAVKMTQMFPPRQPVPFDTGATGFVADILLPTVTIRGIIFRGPRTGGYDGPIRRFNACDMTYLVKPSWGHPYLQYTIEIQSISGAAGDL